MPSTSTSVPFSAKNLRLASARRRVRAFIDQIIELESADFAHLDGEDALKLIKAEFLPLREYLERLPPTADDASVNGACAQTSLMVARYTDILGFILRSTNVRNAFEVHFPLKRLVEAAVSPDARLIMSSEWKFVPFTYPMTLDFLPGFALVGGPASESGNMLIVPLAGHEIGHSAWRSHEVQDKVMDDLVAAVANALETMPGERDVVLKELEVGGSALARLQNAVLRSASKQLEEIFCDLFALYVFGHAYLYAYEYFLAPGGETRAAYYPSSEDRVRYLLDAATALELDVEADLFDPWLEAKAPAAIADRAVLALADAAIAIVYPRLKELTFELLKGATISPPSESVIARVSDSLRRRVPDGDGGTLAEIVTAGWRNLRERGGLALDDEAAEYQMLNELMLKSVEVSEFRLRVGDYA
jgi:hypothetical protein